MSQELKERTQLTWETTPEQPLSAPARTAVFPWAKAAIGISALALVISCAALVASLKPADTQTPEQTPPAQSQPAEPRKAPSVLTYRDMELPVLENVALNRHDLSCFSSTPQGQLQYKTAAGEARRGIDVSSYQGEIDWKLVADSGIEFAMIRCGYRGYTKGVIAKDKYFTKNIRGALNAGLEVGVYFFSQATNVWEAEEEADYVLQVIKGYNITYPVVFDWEYISDSSDARTNSMQGDDITRCAGAFCDMVAQAGYDPVVYFNKDLGYLGYQLDRLTDYTFWLAEYASTPSFHYDFDMWQYSDKGSVPGIKGSVDLNLDLRNL